MVITYSNPAVAYLGPCDTKAATAIFALHFYHMIFYRPLPAIDWIHHLVMVVWML